jgi:putative hydrolase of the HAD superfamily
VIKAVFFDWFDTVARYEPSREELYQGGFKEFGLELSLKDIHRGIMAGDRQFVSSGAWSIVRGRRFDEVPELFGAYPAAMLEEAQLVLPLEAQLQLVKKVLGQFKPAWKLFDDVLPVLPFLKNKDLKLGVITNAEKGIELIAQKLGLGAFLDFMITSDQVGSEKPAAPIFVAALERAGVKADEAVHVGDQYKVDVIGARGVGINPILLDRYETATAVTDCPRICSLNQLAQYL